MPIAFKVPRFYPILDTALLRRRGCAPVLAAEALLAAGARILQYRHKDDWRQSDFDTARQIAKLCHEAGVLFVLNDRADFARLLGAALHIGQDDLPPVAARRVVSDEVMGFSTHNKQQLARANEEPVEYLSIGPIFPTTSKDRPDPVVGLDRLRELRTLTAKPLVAIGGITMLNAREVLAGGADSVALISGILAENCDRKSLRRTAEEWIRLVGVAAAPDRIGV
ncbi:MAG: thiamine phosphate synthase [Acidobacteriaceae bacterium]|nr:thiamine phosphate synthase [Acidobacteriaceae bacterium]